MVCACVCVCVCVGVGGVGGTSTKSKVKETLMVTLPHTNQHDTQTTRTSLQCVTIPIDRSYNIQSLSFQSSLFL